MKDKLKELLKKYEQQIEKTYLHKNEKDTIIKYLRCIISDVYELTENNLKEFQTFIGRTITIADGTKGMKRG